LSRKLKYDIPGRDYRCEIGELRDRGFAGLFAPDLEKPAEQVLEIGYGRGEFLIALARERPATAFLGVELSYKRSLKMARRLAKSEITNIRLLRAPAEQVVGQGLAVSSVDVCWINYPDPWPKKRHGHHRLFQRPFVRALAGRLVPGGTLHAATDDPAYALQIDASLSAAPMLENCYAPDSWLPAVPGRLVTAYEREWRAEGRPLHFFAYRRAA